MKKVKLDFPIMADTDMSAARAMGLVFKIDDKTKAMFMKYNIDLEALYGRANPIMPTPAIIVVDEKGVIRFVYANPDYSVRLHPEVLKSIMQHQ